MRRIYLDNNATTPVLPAMVDAMRPFWAESFGNASAVHEHGRNARAAIDTAREQVAALLNARSGEITFTSGGTESDNHALFGLLSPGQHLITTSIEHHAVLHAAQELEKRGVEVTYLPPTRHGVVRPEAVREAMRPNTALVSVMLANNETGVLQPVEAIGILAHRRGVLLHTDAVQAAGKVAIDTRTLGADLISLSAHKMHAPQGVGALWMRRGIPLRPLLHGGPHERQRRAGTENVPGVVAFGEAAAQATEWLADDGTALLTRLHRDFEVELLRRLPGSILNGVAPATTAGAAYGDAFTEAIPRLPNTTSIQFPGVDSEALVIALDLKGLAISGGSACSSGAVEPSHVLTAMGLSDTEARSTVRISLSRRTSAEELALALDLLETTVKHLQSMR